MTEAQKTELAFLKRSVSIQIVNLHKNAEEQPDLFDKAGELYADLKAEARRKKIDVDSAKAVVDKDARRHPETYGLEKTTEATIQSAIALAPAVKEAQEAHIDAEHEADLASATLNALEHRKSMITNEVKLYLGNYFGEVGVQEMSGAESSVVTKKATDLDRVERPKRTRRTSE